MTGFSRHFKSDSGVMLEIDGSIRHVSWDHIELIEYKAWRLKDANNPNAPFVKLTPAEDERLLEELYADESTWEYPSDDS